MLKKEYPYYLANKPMMPNMDLEATDKYSGEMAVRVAMADETGIKRAITMAVKAAEPMRMMPAFIRW